MTSMINFKLNGKNIAYSGPEEEVLLDCLRLTYRLTAAKDGCSGQGSCGACTVEIDGQPRLACRTKMKDLEGCSVITAEGLPDDFRRLIGRMFAEKGAVQCGFCSPGFIMRSHQLFEKAKAAGFLPSRAEIIKAINPNICRCTGYVKIVDALEAAMFKYVTIKDVNHDSRSGFAGTRQNELIEMPGAQIGSRFPKYQAEDTALGIRPFVADMHVDKMLYGALRFSDHARARVLSIDTAAAMKLPGVVRIFTAEDVPGERFTGLIINDWPLMVKAGDIIHCVGDVLAGVVAVSEKIARKAAALIRVEYEVLPAVTNVHEAAGPDSIRVHENRSNVLETCSISFGNAGAAFKKAAWVSEGVYETQLVEHAFLETETAIAVYHEGDIRLYSQGQGAYIDRRLVARLLGLPEQKVRVIQVQNGGGFGGKEDLTVQGHAALFAWHLEQAVRVHLNRDESIRMHPKRHPVWMDIALAADREGKFTALRLRAVGDTGAYASVGTKVMERVVGHATGAYSISSVDIQATTVYTNNIPSGAMRGFGVPQVNFAIECCIDDICRRGGFDRWKIRFDNALVDGARTATGQKLSGVGLRKTLLAVKEAFRSARYAGIACGIKNTGVGNGLIDDSEVIIEIVSGRRVVIHHGWTEMGQGVHTMAIQTLFEETGIDPGIVEVVVDTDAGIPTGMTTSSRATALLGKAIIDAAKALNKDIKAAAKAGIPSQKREIPESLAGRVYKGKYVVDWTCKPGAATVDPKIHFAYGYATQVVILDDAGRIRRVVAAHDAGKIMNRMLFEGQIEGAIHMGLGYALSENLHLKDGKPISTKYKDLGVLRASQMPEIEVIGVEEKDPYGPYGAKGIGEIGMVPTAAAAANAFYSFDGIKRTRLPLASTATDSNN